MVLSVANMLDDAFTDAVANVVTDIVINFVANVTTNTSIRLSCHQSDHWGGASLPAHSFHDNYHIDMYPNNHLLPVTKITQKITA